MTTSINSDVFGQDLQVRSDFQAMLNAFSNSPRLIDLLNLMAQVDQGGDGSIRLVDATKGESGTFTITKDGKPIIVIDPNMFPDSGTSGHDLTWNVFATTLAHELGHAVGGGNVDIVSANDPDGAVAIGERNEGVALLNEFLVSEELHTAMHSDPSGTLQNELYTMQALDGDNFTAEAISFGASYTAPLNPSSASHLTYEQYYKDQWIINRVNTKYDPVYDDASGAVRKVDWENLLPGAIDSHKNDDGTWTLTGNNIPVLNIDGSSGGKESFAATTSVQGGLIAADETLTQTLDTNGDGIPDQTKTTNHVYSPSTTATPTADTTTTILRDAAGRVTYVLVVNDKTPTSFTFVVAMSYEYDGAGNLTKVSTSRADGSDRTDIYDPAANTHTSITHDGHGNNETIHYDSNGNRTSDTWQHAGGSHGSDIYENNVAVSGVNYNADNSYTTYSIDGGSKETISYDSNGTKLTDTLENANGTGTYSATNLGDGVTNTWTHDAFGRTLSLQVEGSDFASLDTFAYYSDGHIRQIDRSATFTYNGQQLHQLESLAFNEDGTYASWTYNNPYSGSDQMYAGSRAANRGAPDWAVIPGVVNANGDASHYALYSNSISDASWNIPAPNDVTGQSSNQASVYGSTFNTYSVGPEGEKEVATFTVGDGSIILASREIEHPDGTLEDYSFTNNGASYAATIRHPDGRYSALSDDGHGNKSRTDYAVGGFAISASQLYSDGSSVTNTFNLVGQLATTDQHNADGSLESDSYVYGADGSYTQSQRLTAAGSTASTTVVYDINASGQLAGRAVHNADGSAETDAYVYNVDGSYSQTQIFTAAGATTSSRVVYYINADGQFTRTDSQNADGSTELNTYVYDADGSHLRTQVWTAAGAIAPTTALYYIDSNGLLTQRNVQFADGSTQADTYVYSFDGSYIQTQVWTTAGATSPMTVVYSIDASGNLTERDVQFADGSAQTDNYVYGSDGSYTQTQVLTASSGTNLTTTAFEVNASGQLTERNIHFSDGSTQADTYSYNSDGSYTETQVSTAAGVSGTPVTYGFDSAGTLLSQSTQNADGSSVTNNYDSNGRIVRTELDNLDGSRTTTNYSYATDGASVVSTIVLTVDGDTTETVSKYDAAGHLFAQSILNSNGSSTINTYDLNGHLLSSDQYAVDGSADLTTYTSDGTTLTEVWRNVDQSGGYFANDSADGVTNTWHYNASGHTTSFDWKNADGTTGAIDFSYFADGHLSGAITHASDGSTWTLQYNEQGNITSDSRLLADGTTVAQSWDSVRGAADWGSMPGVEAPIADISIYESLSSTNAHFLFHLADPEDPFSHSTGVSVSSDGSQLSFGSINADGSWTSFGYLPQGGNSITVHAVDGTMTTDDYDVDGRLTDHIVHNPYGIIETLTYAADGTYVDARIFPPGLVGYGGAYGSVNTLSDVSHYSAADQLMLEVSTFSDGSSEQYTEHYDLQGRADEQDYQASWGTSSVKTYSYYADGQPNTLDWRRSDGSFDTTVFGEDNSYSESWSYHSGDSGDASWNSVNGEVVLHYYWNNGETNTFGGVLATQPHGSEWGSTESQRNRGNFGGESDGWGFGGVALATNPDDGSSGGSGSGSGTSPGLGGGYVPPTVERQMPYGSTENLSGIAGLNGDLAHDYPIITSSLGSNSSLTIGA